MVEVMINVILEFSLFVISEAILAGVLKPFKPYSSLLVTSYCTLCTGSASAERVGQWKREVSA